MASPNRIPIRSTGRKLTIGPVFATPSWSARWPSWNTHTTTPIDAAMLSRKPAADRHVLRQRRGERVRGVDVERRRAGDVDVGPGLLRDLGRPRTDEVDE